MIGLTLVTVVAVLGASLTSATPHRGHRRRSPPTTSSLPRTDQPFRAAVRRQAGGGGRRQGRHRTSAPRRRSSKAPSTAISGIDPATIGRFYDFAWSTGSARTLAQLGDDGALVTKRFAEANHIAVGGKLAITTPAGKKGALVVRGIYDAPASAPLLGDVSISRQAFDAAFRNPGTASRSSTRTRNRRRHSKSVTAGLGDVRVHTRSAFAQAKTKDTATMVAILYVLLGFSIVVSLMGMVNTMVLSVFERTREIGMLRTLGMTRRQARRMIRHESIITALIGATLGLGLGLFGGVVVTHAAPDYTALTIPWLALAGFTFVAVLAGIAAAVMPARRASRLNVLDAVSYE